MRRNTAFARALDRARRHLAANDARLGQLIAAIGPCTLQPPGEDRFATLVRAIVAQMISSLAAKSIYERLEALFRKGLSPAAVLDLEADRLRGVGLSGIKAGALRALAEQVHQGQLVLESLDQNDETKAIELLSAIRGIGPWTAQMYLLFGVGRLTVLPVGDFGLRSGVQELYGLRALPTAKQLHKIARPWHPYCSIATWYLWRSRGWVPQSADDEPAA
jgi:DNA-3-methyladenine glycosylase II